MDRRMILAGVLGAALVLTTSANSTHAQMVVNAWGGTVAPTWGIPGTVVTPFPTMAPTVVTYPGYAQPGFGQPIYAQQIYGQPVYAQQVYAQPVMRPVMPPPVMYGGYRPDGVPGYGYGRPGFGIGFGYGGYGRRW